MPQTRHAELINLSGHFAYDIQDDPELRKEFHSIPGMNFKIINYKKDSKTGLNAAVVQKNDTNEYSIIYVGSHDAKDWKEDAKLVTAITPPQYKAALNYYKEMNKKYNIQFVAGNSLGGGLANYVALNDPNVTSVTLDPAPVPVGSEREGVKNVYNYIVDDNPSLTVGDRGLANFARKLKDSQKCVAGFKLSLNYQASDTKKY